MNRGLRYLHATESAIRLLFEGMGAYRRLLQEGMGPFFVGTFGDREAADKALKSWSAANEEKITRSLAKQREYMAESFAFATLSGCVLQIAAKGIELHSTNSVVPDGWNGLLQ